VAGTRVTDNGCATELVPIAEFLQNKTPPAGYENRNDLKFRFLF